MEPVKPPKLYARIKQYLHTRIAAGDWRDGSRIPSEYELMAQFGASRMTVHRALREMSAAGILHRVQGVGSFVRTPPARSDLLEIFDIAEDICRRGHVHASQIIKLEAQRADAALAAEFTLRPRRKIFYSEILHLEDGVPVQLEQRLVSPHFAPDYLAQDFSQSTTNRYLQGIARPSEVEHVIHAVSPSPYVQTLLQIQAGAPCLQMSRKTWTADGQATRSLLTHPGGRYSLGSRYVPGR